MVAIVVVPTPPLGLNTVITRRALGSPIDAVTRGATGAALVDRSNRSDTRLDAGLELELVERPGDDLVGARLEQRDPLLDVVGLGDREDRQPRRGVVARAAPRSRPATVYGSLTRSTMTRL